MVVAHTSVAVEAASSHAPWRPRRQASASMPVSPAKARAARAKVTTAMFKSVFTLSNGMGPANVTPRGYLTGPYLTPS